MRHTQNCMSVKTLSGAIAIAATISVATYLYFQVIRDPNQEPGEPASQSAVSPAEPLDIAEPSPDATPKDIAASRITAKWTGDLDGMIERRIIRVATTYSKTNYFIDKGVQRGTAYEAFKLFEDELNASLKKKNVRVHVVFIPMSRDALLPAVITGRADLAAAALTVTAERQARVDFSPPTRTDIDEIVVTGPGAPAIASLSDLAGKEVFVRPSSSYHEHLVALNARLKAEGKPAVVLKPAPETLEDDDLLEMVNAGLVKIIVVDNYLAEFWKQLLPQLTLHPDVAVATGGVLGVAMRKNSPQLMVKTGEWIKKYGPKTTFGNMMTQRYLENTKFAKSATSAAEMKRFSQTVELFRKYGQQYDLDFLLMAAQGFQESGLDHSV